MEIPIGSFSSKYLYKYTLKGSDRSMTAIQREGDIDEIKQYQDLRSIGSSEACWKLFSFSNFDRHPAVYALRIHMPDQQLVYFQEGQEREVAGRDQHSRKTELTEFFTYNQKHPFTRYILYSINKSILIFLFENRCKYVDFPRNFVWNKTQKCWKPRQRQFDTIGRIHSVHPTAGDIFYLRMLLHHQHSEGILLICTIVKYYQIAK